jgi:hypothetical protein
MISRPILAFIEEKLHKVCIEGTHVRESGLVVSTEKLPGETISFFKIDSTDGRKCLLMIEERIQICDYLVFYAKDNQNREVICFLELKGKKLDIAVQQVISTHQYFKELLKSTGTQKQSQHLTYKACICLHGHAPRNDQRSEKSLIDIFGKENIRIKHGVKHYKLLGAFLRE